MIAQLTGQVVCRQPPCLVVDVNGVGYELQAPMGVFYELPQSGTVTLLTHLQVREDQHSLYGFLHARELALFRSLIKVSGVGPKLALSILSSMTPSDFAQCIELQETQRLLAIPGVGKKMVGRLMIECASACEAWRLPVPTEDGRLLVQMSPTEEAISALQGLGYKRSEAELRVNRVANDHQTTEALIRAALAKVAAV